MYRSQSMQYQIDSSESTSQPEPYSQQSVAYPAMSYDTCQDSYAMTPTVQMVNVHYTTNTFQPDSSVSHGTYAYDSRQIPIYASGGLFETESKTVFVGNLDFRVKKSELQGLFSKAGRVEHVHILTKTNGAPKGAATVSYLSAEEAELAKRMFNGQRIRSRKIEVRDAVERSSIAKPSGVPVPQRTSERPPMIVSGSTASLADVPPSRNSKRKESNPT